MAKHDKGLRKNSANYTCLSPISFLSRASEVYPNRVAVIDGDISENWSEVYRKSCGLATALRNVGVEVGDTVAVMAPNTAEMYHCHFGVPMSGAVLNALNTRLDPASIAFMLSHGDAKVLLVDGEFSNVVEKALGMMETPPLVVHIPQEGCERAALGDYDYSKFIEPENVELNWPLPSNEWDSIALSYTSGTTGDPKGVVTHHRGAYLNAVGNVLTWAMPHFPIYLWTLPMFHCNGWCFPWTIASLAGTNICLRRFDVLEVINLIEKHKVTHFCGAPVIYNMLVNSKVRKSKTFSHGVSGMVAGAAPPTSLIEKAEAIGVTLTHVYGLTEVYGPAAVCAKHPEWDLMPASKRASLNGRQGVRYLMQEGMSVVDPKTLVPVPKDGDTIGEIVFRGNITMKGYLNNPAATNKAFKGGWFHTGDLATVDKQGYVKIKDRVKDIIISGGENISTIEIEDVLYSHEGILEAAVVAKPDDKWGEVPCAFVDLSHSLSGGSSLTEKDIIKFCREQMAHFKCPRHVVFGSLPKTSTGKVQKSVLREQAKLL